MPHTLYRVVGAINGTHQGARTLGPLLKAFILRTGDGMEVGMRMPSLVGDTGSSRM